MYPSTTPLPLTVTHRGIDLTIETDIRVGDVLLVRYMAGTRHLDTADTVARQVIAAALGPLFTAAAEASEVRTLASGSFYDDTDRSEP